jgi:hypothetical protein
MKKGIAIIILGLLLCNFSFAEVVCYTERCNPYSKYQNPYSEYQNPYSKYQNPYSEYQNPYSQKYIPSCTLTGAC